jgi:ubiquinone/menaquinone biosynthesis C-methylase UbiE
VIRSQDDPTAAARGLRESFLANRAERTFKAYTIDIGEFARFLNEAPDVALAQFLAGGPGAAHRVVLAYAIDLRQRGRAPATINRRLITLRALTRAARNLRLIEWVLDMPSADQVSAAIEERSTSDSARYLMPRHPGEIDRLDIQHYSLRETLGANYLAPVGLPRRVLDVGCGTGQWGFEVSTQFPEALVIGLDLVAGKAEQPSRYCWVKGNVLQGLPFANDQFDFVHQRLLITGVPLSSWPTVVLDLVRVTRAGGWVELVEPPFTIEGSGPATVRLVGLTTQMAASLGLDTTSVVFESLDDYLRQAGLARVVRRQLSVPIGRWGGQIGSLMVTDLRAGFTRVSEVLQARSSLTAEDAGDLIRRAQEEWEEGRMSWTFGIAFGQKPG